MTSTPSQPKAATPANTHPLVLAAVVVWLSIDLIGDGLVAVRSLLASVTSERSVTPS
jgi:hypothetical protein